MTQVQPFYGVYHSVEEVDTLTDDFNKIWHYYAKSVHICHKNSEGEHIAQADVSQKSFLMRMYWNFAGEKKVEKESTVGLSQRTIYRVYFNSSRLYKGSEE